MTTAAAAPVLTIGVTSSSSTTTMQWAPSCEFKERTALLTCFSFKKKKFAFSHQSWFHFIMILDHLSYENPSAQIIVVSPTMAMVVLPKNLSLFSNSKPSIQFSSIQFHSIQYSFTSSLRTHTPRIQNLQLYVLLSLSLSVSSRITQHSDIAPNVCSAVYHLNVYANSSVLNEFEMSKIRQFYNGIFSTKCANYH